MSKMSKADVLISGLSGLGVEIGWLKITKVLYSFLKAKNVVLAGVKSITLHDSVVATHKDQSTQVHCIHLYFVLTQYCSFSLVKINLV